MIIILESHHNQKKIMIFLSSFFVIEIQIFVNSSLKDNEESKLNNNDNYSSKVDSTGDIDSIVAVGTSENTTAIIRTSPSPAPSQTVYIEDSNKPQSIVTLQNPDLIEDSQVSGKNSHHDDDDEMKRSDSGLGEHHQVNRIYYAFLSFS